MKRSTRRLILMSVMILWSVGTGCATSRGVLEIDIPAVKRPETGPAFKIVSVLDSRVFEERPSKPSIPSLKHRSQIGDPAITSRAIARKRNGYGKAMGDILLPEGKTVMDLVRAAVTRAMNEVEIRVVNEDEPELDSARPVDVDIQQFWAWFSPGFWTVALEFDARLRITTDLGDFRDGEGAHGYTRLKSFAEDAGAWRNTIDKGLEELNTDLKQKLQQSMAQHSR